MNMKKKHILSLCILAAWGGTADARSYELKSPDGRNVVRIEADGAVHYSLARDGQPVLDACHLTLTVDGDTWGTDARCRSARREAMEQIVEFPVARRARTMTDMYNKLVLRYKGYDIEFRAYDEGVAYRFVSQSPDADEVQAEGVQFNLAGNPMTYTQLTDRLQQWFEYNYTERKAADLPADSLIIPPMLALSGPYKVLFAEADVYHYPGLYLRPGSEGLEGEWAYYPATEKVMENGNKLYADQREDYLTANAGCRTFPWRVTAVYDNEADMLGSELIYLLASEPEPDADFSWVRPGKVLWDWWNCWNVYGVDFKAGINTDTYKYLIDYAAEHGLEYVLFDEGWSAPFDLLTLSPDVDMEAVCRYAEQQGVGVLLWTKWVNLNRQMTEALDLMARWGVKGIKVDFMDRNDAKMVDFYEHTARETAKRHMLVNFHGSYPPDGMRRRYPNIMTREGVYGLENNKWSTRITPRHDVLLAYIRQFSGPMDYTPGSMLNAHADRFRVVHDEPMSQGTRSHQVAMYVIYDSPLQTLADSPVLYDQNPESRDFIKQIPTVWDETVPLGGRLGEYVALARRSGDKWYIGVMNGTDKPLHLDLDLSFAGDGKKTISCHADGPNAARQAKDAIVTTSVSDNDTLSIDMAHGGGYAAIITTTK